MLVARRVKRFRHPKTKKNLNMNVFTQEDACSFPVLPMTKFQNFACHVSHGKKTNIPFHHTGWLTTEFRNFMIRPNQGVLT